MSLRELIIKKRDGGELTESEIESFVAGVVGGEPDYQIAAMLMAIYFRGMTADETRFLTQAMAHSGDMLDLSGLPGIKLDKHSTGGVGDKTTLTLAPVLAAAGLTIAKLSGRGLGHTGGTLDKLESIPGFRTELSSEEFLSLVSKNGIAVAGQSASLAPADKRMYALRDVTGTIESIPLIASSVMSKKLASGAEIILLDVKYGSGAFMKTPESAAELARVMVEIGNGVGRRVSALVTDMDKPLGFAVGNALEAAEAAELLHGRGPADLREETLALAERALVLAGRGDGAYCRALAERMITSGAALEKLCLMVRSQGGDERYVRDPSLFGKASKMRAVRAKRAGYVTSMTTDSIGGSALLLGAGREKKEENVDHAAGIVLEKKTGDLVEEGSVLAYLYTNRDDAALDRAEELFLSAVTIGPEPPEARPLVYAVVE